MFKNSNLLNFFKSKKKSVKKYEETERKQDPYTIFPAPEGGFKTRLTPDLLALKSWYYPGSGDEVRKYQYKLIQKSLTHNTFVAIPTGTGKTYIAAGVILNYYRWFP